MTWLKQSPKLDYIFLILFLGGLFTAGLGGRPLSSPDEGRYAEIPREMVASQDYLTPHLNGLKYFEKPPFVYWLETVPLNLGFSSEFALRLPIAFFALLGCLSVYAFCARIYSRKTGLASAIILGTSTLYFALGRIILLDLVFSVLIACGLLSFIVGVRLVPGKERRLHLMLSAIFFGVAVLTKGLIGIVFPLGIIGVWVVALNKWRLLKPLYLPTNLSIFLLITVPWHFLVSKENAQFFDFYFIHEHFLRYLTTIHRRFQPFWFFVPIFFIGFLPWIFFLPKGFKNLIPSKIKDWKIYDIEAFLVIWFVFIFAFFSLSSSKLIPYILPVFFPAAITVGRYIVYVMENEKSYKTEAWTYTVISWALGFGIPYALISRNDIELYQALLPYLSILKIVLCSGSFLLLIISYSKFAKWGFFVTLTTQIIFLFIVNAAGPFLQKASMKPFAEQVFKNMSTETEVIVYGFYPQDLPYYLQRTLKILNWSGELDFGKKLAPRNSVFLTDQSFKSFWTQKENVCVIAQSSRIREVPFPHKNKNDFFQYNDYTMVCKQSK